MEHEGYIWNCVDEDELPKYVMNLLEKKIDFIIENPHSGDGAYIAFYSEEDYEASLDY